MWSTRSPQPPWAAGASALQASAHTGSTLLPMPHRQRLGHAQPGTGASLGKAAENRVHETNAYREQERRGQSEAGGAPIKHITFFASAKKGTRSPASFNTSQLQSTFCFPGRKESWVEKHPQSSGTQQGKCHDEWPLAPGLGAGAEPASGTWADQSVPSFRFACCADRTQYGQTCRLSKKSRN